MAQYRQSGMERYDRLHHYHHHSSNGALSNDHMSIGIRSMPYNKQVLQARRLVRSDKLRLSIGSVVFVLFLVLIVTVLAYFTSPDLVITLTITIKGSTAHGRDSRYWDKDDRRRDDDYNEDVVEHASMDTRDESASMSHVFVKLDNRSKKISSDDPHKSSERKGIRLYNEAGLHELKWYEAEYEVSLKSMGQSGNDTRNKDQQSNDKESIDVDDEYDDNVEFHGTKYEEYDDSENDKMDYSDLAKIQNQFHRESSDLHHARKQDQNIATKVEEAFDNLSVDSSLKSQNLGNDANYKHVSLGGGQSTKASRSESKRKGKRRIFGFWLVAKEKDGLLFSRQYFFC